MTEITATERTRWQGLRLRKLREDRGVSKARLMDTLGFGSSQTYDLYERGVTVLRADRIAAWAAAFGVDEHEFFSLILASESPLDIRIQEDIFRSAMRGIITEAQIAEQWDEIKDDPIKDQMAHALDLQLDAERRKSEAMQPPQKQPRRRRPAPERTARGA